LPRRSKHAAPCARTRPVSRPCCTVLAVPLSERMFRACTVEFDAAARALDNRPLERFTAGWTIYHQIADSRESMLR